MVSLNLEAIDVQNIKILVKDVRQVISKTW